MPDLLEEQAALYVFGLLDPKETANFEERLGSDPLLLQLVREFWEIIALFLALIARQASQHPSPWLKQRILSRIDLRQQAHNGH